MTDLMMVNRSFVNVSAQATTGSTLTRAESFRMVVMSTEGRVGRQMAELVGTGGSKITVESMSPGLDTLFVRARGTAGGRGGEETDGGTISSGSRKYMHLKRG